MPPEDTTATAVADVKDASASASPDATKLESAASPPADSSASDNSEEAKAPSIIDEAVNASVSKQLSDLALDLGIDGEFKTAADLRDAIKAAQNTAREQRVEKTVETHYTETYNSIAEQLSGLTFKIETEDGEFEDAGLTEDAIKDILAPVAALRQQVRQAEALETYQELGLVASQMLPASVHESFEKAAQGADGKGLSIKEWTNVLAEHMAPHTKAWKANEKAHDEAIAHAKAEAWIEGNKAPPGTPSQKNAGNRSSGQMTADSFMSMSPDERVTWSRANPEEFKKLGT